MSPARIRDALARAAATGDAERAVDVHADGGVAVCMFGGSEVRFLFFGTGGAYTVLRFSFDLS